MNIKTNYKHTIAACYIGYITQAIINNFIPLLFITFHNTYNISIEKIGLLVMVNFFTQLFVDLIAAKAAVLAEGDASERDDIIYLEKLPLFFK